MPQSPPKNPWIDAVIDSYPDDDPKNEQRRHLLFEAATAVPLESHPVDPSPPPRSRKSHLLTITLAFISLGLFWLVVASPGATERWRGIALVSQIGFTEPDIRADRLLRIFETLSWEQRWRPFSLYSTLATRVPASKVDLVLGDTGQLQPDKRWLAAWKGTPAEPATFAERFRRESVMPDADFDSLLLQAEKIDPGNGYYHLVISTLLTGKAFDEDVGYEPRWEPKERLLVDSKSYEQAWFLLEKALGSQFIADRCDERLDARFKNWPAPTQFSDIGLDLAIVSDAKAINPPLCFSRLAYLFVGRAEGWRASNQPRDIASLARLWRATLASLVSETMGGDAKHWNFTVLSAQSMARACEHAGLPNEAEFFDSYLDHQKEIIRLTSKVPGLDTQRSSISFHGQPAPYARLAEHRMFESLYLTYAMIITLILLGILSTLSLTSSSRLLWLPARVSSVLLPRDYVRVFLLGILAPTAFIVATLEIPFLHPRDTTMNGLHAAAVLLKLASLIVAVLFLTVREISLALTRRAAPLGFRPIARTPLLLLGLLALACAPTATALMQLDRFFPDIDPEPIWLSFFGMLGLLLVLFLLSFGTLLYSGHRRLQAATALRALTRPLTATACLFAVWTGVDRLIESHHVSHATAERIDSPEAMAAYRGQDPLSLQIRQIMEDYLATAPE